MQGMKLGKAKAFLQDVLEYKRAVPFTRYGFSGRLWWLVGLGNTLLVHVQWELFETCLAAGIRGRVHRSTWCSFTLSGVRMGETARAVVESLIAQQEMPKSSHINHG